MIKAGLNVFFMAQNTIKQTKIRQIETGWSCDC